MTFRAPGLWCAVFFLDGFVVCHSAFIHFILGSNDCICDSSVVKMRWRNALPSFLPYCKWVIEEDAWHFGHCWVCGNSLFTNFSCLQAVGKDTVNTCWRDSDFYSLCYADFPSFMWCLSIACVTASH
jgi:hypothetical protein